MSEQIFLKFALKYNQDKLKGKYHRMRSTHTKFNELISITGVTWDSLSGMVSANDTVWDDLFKRDRIFKTFKKKGCKLFSLLTMVFGNSTASGAFHNPSTAAPVSSDEERRIETDYLMGSAGPEHRSGDKRKSADSLDHGIRMRRVKKPTGKDKMDAFLEDWSTLSVTRKDTYLMKQERYRSTATSSVTDDSLEQCMALLNAMRADISNKAYIAAVKQFENPHYKKSFLMMAEDMQKVWVSSLDES